MATTLKVSGDIVYINNVRFKKSSLVGTPTENGWTIRGNKIDVIVPDCFAGNTVNVDTGLVFESEEDLTSWLQTNVFDAGSGGEVVIPDGSITEPKLATALTNKINGAAAESEVILIGGQAPSGPLIFGATNDQSVNIQTRGFDRITIDGIGNVGIGVPDPEAPLAVAGAITVAAGSVSTEWNPTSGTNLTLGTVSNHAVNIIANGVTILTLHSAGVTVAAGTLNMGTKKIVSVSAGTDPGDAVNFQQLGTKLTATTAQFNAKLTATPAAVQADSTATDIAGLVTDFNALLAKLRTAGILAA